MVDNGSQVLFLGGPLALHGLRDAIPCHYVASLGRRSLLGVLKVDQLVLCTDAVASLLGYVGRWRPRDVTETDAWRWTAR